MTDVAIKVKKVSKYFVLPHQKKNTIKSFFVSPFSRVDNEKQKAFENLSFEIKKGEFFGIVGRNGSGKSTLLKCIAGVYSTDTGKIQVNGKLVPFIELGVGFNDELSGRDNVFLNGALLGFSRKEMESMFDKIVEFAELEEFMDQKLKNYSSGMQVRLAFSIAIQAKGDVLLLDEVLAVGDTLFQQKCFRYFDQLKRTGKTVVLVSHDANALRQYCTEGILIDDGEIISSGNIDSVLDKYTDIISKKEAEQVSSSSEKSIDKSRGTLKMLIESVEVSAHGESDTKVFREDNKILNISVSYRCKVAVERPVLGLVIKDGKGNKLFTSNTMWLAEELPNLTEDSRCQITWKVPNIFNTGEYYISPAAAGSSGKEIYNWIEDAAVFRVRKKFTSSALLNPSHDFAFKQIVDKPDN